MKKYLLLVSVVFIAGSFNAYAFDDYLPVADTIPSNTNTDKVFTKVDEEAYFAGGSKAWNDFIKRVIERNISAIIQDNASGTCRMRFIVDTNGIVSNVAALTMQGSKLAEVCTKAIKSGPKWIPAKQNGVPVKAYREQPITFRIQDK